MFQIDIDTTTFEKYYNSVMQLSANLTIVSMECLRNRAHKRLAQARQAVCPTAAEANFPDR